MDIKKVLEAGIELYLYETIGQMRGMSFVEDIVFKDDTSGKQHQELEQELDRIEAVYGIKYDTTLQEALEIINKA